MALEEYILRNPFSVEKMTLEWPADMVIYRSRLNAKINRNFEVFTATTGWRLKAGDCRLAAYARSHKITCL